MIFLLNYGYVGYVPTVLVSGTIAYDKTDHTGKAKHYGNQMRFYFLGLSEKSGGQRSDAFKAECSRH